MLPKFMDLKNSNKMKECNFLKQFRIEKKKFPLFKDLQANFGYLKKSSSWTVFKNPFCNPFPSKPSLATRLTS